MDSTFINEDDKYALQGCFHNGWLHTDELNEIGQTDEIGYFFASWLHCWFMRWKLYDALPSIPFHAVNILEFVVSVIGIFSPRVLSAEQRLGPACVQRLPEA